MSIPTKNKMMENAAEIYPAYYQPIKEVLMATAKNDIGKARALLATLSRNLPFLQDTPEGIQVLFFYEAIRQRLDPDAPELGNLYLMPDQGQQIKMFNLMASKFPLVSFAQSLVNTTCIDEMLREKTVTILDIGIGTGQQIARILEHLSGPCFAGKKITVIGIEPSKASLDKAQNTLMSIAEAKQIRFAFVGINETVEMLMSQSSWNAFERTLQKARESSKLMVNASFSLHHIRPMRHRQLLFQKLRKLAPSLLTIIEPYADFVTPQVFERFENAWLHYGLTFRAIDQIDASDEEKQMIKQIFFSREIQDVLSKNGQRIEQFETGEMWLKRLKKAEFKPYSPEIFPGSISDCPFVTVKRSADYIGLCIEGHPIISILMARL